MEPYSTLNCLNTEVLNHKSAETIKISQCSKNEVRNALRRSNSSLNCRWTTLGAKWIRLNAKQSPSSVFENDTNEKLAHVDEQQVQIIQDGPSMKEYASNSYMCLHSNVNNDCRKTLATECAPLVIKRLHFKTAPYDYKRKFSILQEKHIHLRSQYENINRKYNQLSGLAPKFLSERSNMSTSKPEAHVFALIKKLQNEVEQQKNMNSLLKKKMHECQKLNFKLHFKIITLTQILDMFKDDEVCMTRHISEMGVELEKNRESIDNMGRKLRFADNERRRLHNVIQTLKGNIRVFCRVRPPLPKEQGKPLLEMNIKNNVTLEVNFANPLGPTSLILKRCSKHEFSFDRIFNQEATQQDIFQELGQLVVSVLDGQNACIFAYGQTGSGKTYTMEGGETERTMGMIPRTAKLIFDSIKEREILNWEFQVKASFLEIYNEHIIDLLSDEKKSENLEIRMSGLKGTDVIVTNQIIEVIHSGDELISLLQRVQQKRAVATTVVNANSSRSHLVTKIQLNGYNDLIEETTAGSLNLIDLAGSERPNDLTDSRLIETININKSLAQLTNVILALLQKHEHIPFRNSKLTRLLMPYLQGSAKTLMIVNISPLLECYHETLNSLRFACKVNNCKIGTIK